MNTQVLNAGQVDALVASLSRPRTLPHTDMLDIELGRRFRFGHVYTLEEMRQCSIPVPESGCWIWLRAINTNGYGFACSDRQNWQAHRLAYTIAKGPIAPGLVIDHLCRVPLCINPNHLEAVPQLANILRGVGPQVQRERHASKTHCKRGHPFSAENTRRRPSNPDARICIVCARMHARAISRRWRLNHRKQS